MKEVEFKFEVPEEYVEEVKRLAKNILLEELLSKSLEHCARVELKKKLLKAIASDSKLTEKKAFELSEMIKEGVAKKHGL